MTELTGVNAELAKAVTPVIRHKNSCLESLMRLGEQGVRQLCLCAGPHIGSCCGAACRPRGEKGKCFSLLD